MLKEGPHRDPHVNWLVHEGGRILADPERVQELAGRRLAFRLVELEDHFRTHSYRLGIVGNPHRGKSTYAYSCYETLSDYHFPAHYVDLDIYSPSGLANSGHHDLANRPKRTDAPKEEVLASIRGFRATGPGIVFGDFPGLPDKPYQPRRIKAVDMAIVLGDDSSDRGKWLERLSKAKKDALWLRTRSDNVRAYPLDPTIYALDRKPRPNSLDVVTSLTRILEVIGKKIGIPLANVWEKLPNGRIPFSEPERMVLAEILDFEFAPYARGQEWD